MMLCQRWYNITGGVSTCHTGFIFGGKYGIYKLHDLDNKIIILIQNLSDQQIWLAFLSMLIRNFIHWIVLEKGFTKSLTKGPLVHKR